MDKAFLRHGAAALAAAFAMTMPALAANDAGTGGPIYPGAHQTTPLSNPDTACGSRTQFDGYTVSAPLNTVLAWYRTNVRGKEGTMNFGGLAYHLILSADGKLLVRVTKGHADGETMILLSSFKPPLPPAMSPTDDCLPL